MFISYTFVIPTNLFCTFLKFSPFKHKRDKKLYFGTFFESPCNFLIKEHKN